MLTRLHPPALALFHSIKCDRFRPVEWLNTWYGAWERLPAATLRMAADDFLAVVPLFKEGTPAVSSARRVGRMLARRARRVPVSEVHAWWRPGGVFNRVEQLDAWLEARFGSLAEQGLLRALASVALEMMERLGLLGTSVRLHALVVRTRVALAH